jgi:Protein of unknown function (DUF3500)
VTPLFVGSEPVRATSGKYKGVTVPQQEQNDGLAMLQALSEVQRKQAVLNFSKSGNNNLTEAFKDNAVLDYSPACVPTAWWTRHVSACARRMTVQELLAEDLPLPNAFALESRRRT